MEFVPLATSIAVLLVSIILHEIAHGYVASKLGDPTARDQNRLSLNPLVHLDPVGSVLVPLGLILMNAGFIIGWAKPVPINSAYFKNPKKGSIFVSAAGPATNLLLAATAISIYTIFTVDPGTFFGLVLWMTVIINIVLAVLNLLPFPPLDGSRILWGLLPKKLADQYLKFQSLGSVFIILVLFSGGFDYILAPLIDAVVNFMQ